MAYRCDICGKTRQFGQSIQHKYGGGWARRAHATKRTWKPNLQVKRLPVGAQKVKLKVCAQCLRTIKRQQQDEVKEKTTSPAASE